MFLPAESVGSVSALKASGLEISPHVSYILSWRIFPSSAGSRRASCHHHIIIISILKPVFLYRGLGLFDKSSSKTSSPLRMVHRISKIHSKLLSVIHQHFIQSFLRPAGSLLCNHIQLAYLAWQSSLCCALHVQTTSFYWCGATFPGPVCQALREGSLS